MVFSMNSRSFRRYALVVLAAGLCGPVAAVAQSTPAPAAPAAPTDTVRLSDEQRLAILDRATPESSAAARGEMPESERRTLGIHGEVGAMVGTNGLRSVYGVAQVPFGDSAAATVSFESTHFGSRRR